MEDTAGTRERKHRVSPQGAHRLKGDRQEDQCRGWGWRLPSGRTSSPTSSARQSRPQCQWLWPTGIPCSMLLISYGTLVKPYCNPLFSCPAGHCSFPLSPLTQYQGIPRKHVCGPTALTTASTSNVSWGLAHTPPHPQFCNKHFSMLSLLVYISTSGSERTEPLCLGCRGQSRAAGPSGQSTVPNLWKVTIWIFFFFLAIPSGMWNLSSPTRTGTHAPYSGRVTSEPLDHQGNTLKAWPTSCLCMLSDQF